MEQETPGIKDSDIKANLEKHYERFVQSSQKFDYFITGLSAAVLSYSVQSFDTGTAVKYSYVAPIAWGVLLFAVLAGILRIEASVRLFVIEYDLLLEINKVKENLNEFAKISDKVEAKAVIKAESDLVVLSNKIGKLVDDKSFKKERYDQFYKLNRWLLLAGVLLLGLLKTLNLK